MWRFLAPATLAFAAGCSLLVSPPPCFGGTQLESGHCLRGDLQSEAQWADEVAFRLGLLPPGLDIWLYEDGNSVTERFPGPLPEGGCINGYADPETWEVVAIPGTLPHELLHVRSYALGEYVPVHPTPGMSHVAVYKAQHTPAHGWRDTYDGEVLDVYQSVGWPETPSTVCSGWWDK